MAAGQRPTDNGGADRRYIVDLIDTVREHKLTAWYYKEMTLPWRSSSDEFEDHDIEAGLNASIQEQ